MTHGPRVIGVGDNVVDKYLHTGIMYPGGNALNFAVFSKMAGADAAYLGSFGTDRAAAHVQSVLRDLGVNTSRCRRIDGDNGFARVTLQDGNRVFVPGNAGGVMRLHPLVFSREDMDYIGTFQLAHSSCYSYVEGQLPGLRDTAVPLSFDFSSRIDEEYVRAVCPHLDFAFFSAEERSDEASIGRVFEAMHRLGCTVAAATRGKKGAMVSHRGRLFHQAAEPIQVLDTMGAGDSFIATFLLRSMDAVDWQAERIAECPGEGIRAALRAAAHAAAETCRVSGAFGYGVPFEDGQ